MDGAHREGQHVARLEFRGQPASAKLLAQRCRVLRPEAVPTGPVPFRRAFHARFRNPSSIFATSGTFVQ